MVKFTLPPVAKLVGLHLVKVEKGKAVCVMKAERKHTNMIGTVHGGILCDLSDAAMGFAFFSWLSVNQTGVTVEFKINFLLPVYPGERLKATAKILSRGRSLYYVECEVRNSKNALVAKAASTCKIVQKFSGGEI